MALNDFVLHSRYGFKAFKWDGWERCTGITNSQCYTKANRCVIKGGLGTCQDKSHLVCEKEKTYWNVRGVKASGEQVCTRDKDEMFNCEDNSTCIHQKLLCDGTPQCKSQQVQLRFKSKVQMFYFLRICF